MTTNAPEGWFIFEYEGGSIVVSPDEVAAAVALLAHDEDECCR